MGGTGAAGTGAGCPPACPAAADGWEAGLATGNIKVETCCMHFMAYIWIII